MRYAAGPNVAQVRSTPVDGMRKELDRRATGDYHCSMPRCHMSTGDTMVVRVRAFTWLYFVGGIQQWPKPQPEVKGCGGRERLGTAR
jgi:hypothetical protein